MSTFLRQLWLVNLYHWAYFAAFTVVRWRDFAAVFEASFAFYLTILLLKFIHLPIFLD